MKALIINRFVIVHALLATLPITAQTTAINEEKFVTIGGIEQWITIHGDDSSKTVLLFLHGGPGSTMSQYDDTIYGYWKKDFILVQWDQRGAGRTFGKNIPADYDENYWVENPLTVAQMTDDGIALSEYLIEQLGKEKITLLGTSWGSILGAKMALKRPDLFHAYVGHAQMVSPANDLITAYHKTLEIAEKQKDLESIAGLDSIGPPSYDNAQNTGKFFRIMKQYEREHSTPAPDSWWKLAPEYDNKTDSKHRYDGDDYSFVHFVGHKKMGITAMNATVDFLKNGLEFELPVYFIQGEMDVLTPPEITRAYFDTLKAPKKEYFLLPNAAHGHNQAVVDTQYKIVKEYIIE
ncbi:alpha/beta fold hydrolase [Pricia sp.]|uniref:alpha/beta fold hydrolase n=1 Tax=Pricia sp. TaxID=2268138 RepID=UPI003593E6B5